MSVYDPTCDNCQYETDEISEDTGFCQTCDRAYYIGYRHAEEDCAKAESI